MISPWCATSGLTPRLEIRTVTIGDLQRRVIYLCKDLADIDFEVRARFNTCFARPALPSRSPT